MSFYGFFKKKLNKQMRPIKGFPCQYQLQLSISSTLLQAMCFFFYHFLTPKGPESSNTVLCETNLFFGRLFKIFFFFSSLHPPLLPGQHFHFLVHKVSIEYIRTNPSGEVVIFSLIKDSHLGSFDYILVRPLRSKKVIHDSN